MHTRMKLITYHQSDFMLAFSCYANCSKYHALFCTREETPTNIETKTFLNRKNVICATQLMKTPQWIYVLYFHTHCISCLVKYAFSQLADQSKHITRRGSTYIINEITM